MVEALMGSRSISSSIVESATVGNSRRSFDSAANPTRNSFFSMASPASIKGERFYLGMAGGRQAEAQGRRLHAWEALDEWHLKVGMLAGHVEAEPRYCLQFVTCLEVVLHQCKNKPLEILPASSVPWIKHVPSIRRGGQGRVRGARTARAVYGDANR